MSLIWLSSFDYNVTGNAALTDVNLWDAQGGNWYISSDHYVDSTFDPEGDVSYYTTSANNDHGLLHQFATGNPCTAGMAFRTDFVGNVGSTTSAQSLMDFRAAEDANHTAGVWIEYGNGGRYMDIVVGRFNGYNVPYIELARTYNRPVKLQNWHYLEFQVYHSDSSGYLIVRLDGQEVINVTGVDTRFDPDGNGEGLSHLQLGANGYHSSAYMRFDSVYITNADNTDGQNLTGFLGPLHVTSIFPDGTGSVNNFTGSDGNSVDNHLLVDNKIRSTVEDDDYVESSGVGDIDLYTMTNMWTNDMDIKAVFPVTRTQRIGPTPISGAQIYEINGSIYTGFTYDVPSPVYFEWNNGLGINPDTGSGWIASDINSLQIGTKVIG